MKNNRKKTSIIATCILSLLVLGLGIYTVVHKSGGEDEKSDYKTFSMKELRTYLGYVPNDITNEERSVYHTFKDVNSIGKDILLGSALAHADAEESHLRIETELMDEFLFKREDIDMLMAKMYDAKIDNLSGDGWKQVAEFGNRLFYYSGGFFKASGGGGSPFDTEHYSIIEDYEVDDELIIYERAALISETLDGCEVKDYRTKKIKDINGSIGDAKEYISQNKAEFTKYKHTFKKNSAGYYWYSTEAI